MGEVLSFVLDLNDAPTMEELERREKKSDEDVVAGALSFIPADDYHGWVKIGMAIKSEFGDAGFKLWDDWSRSGETYDERKVFEKWRHIDADGGITIGSLFGAAKDNGWEFERGMERFSKSPERLVYEAEQSRRRKEERDRIEEAEWVAGAQEAKIIWSESRFSDNPYLQAKGIKPHGTRTCSKTGNLLVPMYDMNGNICNLQNIYLGREGSFEKCGVRGAYNNKKRDERHPPVFFAISGNRDKIAIGEGFATMASIHEATGWTCVAAFSQPGLLRVSRAWRKRFPNAEIILCADNDRGGSGEKFCKEAADDVGGVCVVAKIAPEDGSDFNDIAKAKGLDEVRRQLERGSSVFGLFKYSGPQAYIGEPKPIEWVVDGLFQKGAVSLVAGVGAAGKSMLMIDLACKVAMPVGSDNPLDLNWHTSLGNKVVGKGRAVIISAEDSKDELHRRIHSLSYRGESLKDAYFYPVPDEGGAKILMIDDPKTRTIIPTGEWAALRHELKELQPQIVVFDPLASFVSADMDKDNRAGQQAMGLFDSLARELNCAVVVVHHFAKGDKSPKSADDALKLVRGATAIINRCRSVYVLWQASAETTSAVRESGEELIRDSVFNGCAAKMNSNGDKSTRVYLRNKQTGLLEVFSTLSEAELACTVASKREQSLVEFIRAEMSACGGSNPITKSGPSGPFERAKVRKDLGDTSKAVLDVLKITKASVGAMLDELSHSGALSRYIAIGSDVGRKIRKGTVYYDVPGGTLSTDAIFSEE